MSDINTVRAFWEENPLWSGESEYEAGSANFYEEHRSVVIFDCFAGSFDIRFMPPPKKYGQDMKLLDLGCGIGFWSSEFAMRGINNIYAADLTEQALALTQKRLAICGVTAKLNQENAEKLTYSDATFDHVNCQGVIHHTPCIEAAVSEIARVLKNGGTASISVYHHNIILKSWPYLRWLAWFLLRFREGGLKGRGRERLFAEKNVDEIVRLYDGASNPIGKSYTKKQFTTLLSKYFLVKETYCHFFPARALPFNIPITLHRWLDKNFGFMIYATVEKL